jgi:hypothetical protein
VNNLPLNNTIVKELIPGPSLSDEQLKDFIECGPKQFRESKCDKFPLGHLAGTIQMGNRTSSNNNLFVVDAELLVYGVENLRVADASIMPNLVSGNTHATVLMIAEKASQLIINKQNQTKQSNKSNINTPTSNFKSRTDLAKEHHKKSINNHWFISSKTLFQIVLSASVALLLSCCIWKSCFNTSRPHHNYELIQETAPQ